jgi:hypothetical protein
VLEAVSWARRYGVRDRALQLGQRRQERRHRPRRRIWDAIGPLG